MPKIIVDAGHGGYDGGAVGRVSGTPEKGINLDVAMRVQALLEEGKPARALECDEDEVGMMGQMALLTSKPIIYAANL